MRGSHVSTSWSGLLRVFDGRAMSCCLGEVRCGEGVFQLSGNGTVTESSAVREDPNDPLTANGCGPPPVSFSMRPDDGERSLVNCSQFISIVPPSSTCCLPVTSLIDPVATTLIVEDSILN